MIRRAAELLFLTLIGGLIGSRLGGSSVTLLGALAGAGAWLLLDNVRLARLLRWLKLGSAARAPDLGGSWSLVVDRIRKEFKALGRKARKSDARLHAFLAAIQASPNGVVLLNKAQQIEWCNLTASQHLGFDQVRDVGQQVRNLLRDPAFIAYLNAGDFSSAVEVDGREAYPGHPHRIAIHIHGYGKGRAMMLSRDITALQRAEAMRRDFVANVSHEIRTPLTVVSGFVETLQHLQLDEDERTRYLGLIGQQTARMQTLVSDLLTLSRLEGSPMPDTHVWVDPNELLDAVLVEARALSGVVAQGQHELVAMPGPAMEIAVERNELRSAMSNLMSNAVRYTPPGGRIEAGWRMLPDDCLEFYVTDSGPGIAPEHLPRLTERFYRVDSSRSRDTGGTGLGLAIVKHVAQRHGGQMRITSTVGQGSTFSICLPHSRVLLHSV